MMLRVALILVAIRAQTAPPVSGPPAEPAEPRSLEMSDRQSSYEPPVVQGERVPAPMGRVPPSKLDSPRGAVV